MKENLKYLIHFLFVLDLNKSIKIEYSDFELYNDFELLKFYAEVDNANFALIPVDHFISDVDLKWLMSNRQYSICKFEQATSKKDYFFKDSKQWLIPHINLDRENIFSEEIFETIDENKETERNNKLYGNTYNILPMKFNNRQGDYDIFSSSYLPSFDQIDALKNVKAPCKFIASQISYATCISLLLDKNLLKEHVLYMKKWGDDLNKRLKNEAAEEERRYMTKGWESGYFDAMGGNMGDYNGDGDDIDNWARG